VSDKKEPRLPAKKSPAQRSQKESGPAAVQPPAASDGWATVVKKSGSKPKAVADEPSPSPSWSAEPSPAVTPTISSKPPRAPPTESGPIAKSPAREPKGLPPSMQVQGAWAQGAPKGSSGFKDASAKGSPKPGTRAQRPRTPPRSSNESTPDSQALRGKGEKKKKGGGKERGTPDGPTAPFNPKKSVVNDKDEWWMYYDKPEGAANMTQETFEDSMDLLGTFNNMAQVRAAGENPSSSHRAPSYCALL
jgi:hypothetical protein